MIQRQEINSVTPQEFEAETRVVVMDFMGLVPLSCPPTSAFFKPFGTSHGQTASEFTFDNDSFLNNNNNSVYCTSYQSAKRNCAPRRVSSAKGPASTPRPKSVKQSRSFRTIIRKNDKFIVLEDASEKVDATDDSIEILDNCQVQAFTTSVNKDNIYSNKLNGRSNKLDLSLKLNGLSRPRAPPVAAVKSCGIKMPQVSKRILETQVPSGISVQGKTSGHLVNGCSSQGSPQYGSSVDYPSVTNSLGQENRASNQFLSNKENLYVDINAVLALESLIDKGEVSPVAAPLQSELNGLRFSDSDGTGADIFMPLIQSPLSPQSQIADTLRALADQVQEEFAYELSGAVGKLVNFEEGKKLTFEVLRDVTMELIKDISPGWSRVVMPLVLSQLAAMSLLLLGNRSIVGKLVDFTTKFLCDTMNDFIRTRGGWGAARETGIREIPMYLQQFAMEDPE